MRPSWPSAAGQRPGENQRRLGAVHQAACERSRRWLRGQTAGESRKQKRASHWRHRHMNNNSSAVAAAAAAACWLAVGRKISNRPRGRSSKGSGSGRRQRPREARSSLNWLGHSSEASETSAKSSSSIGQPTAVGSSHVPSSRDQRKQTKGAASAAAASAAGAISQRQKRVVNFGKFGRKSVGQAKAPEQPESGAEAPAEKAPDCAEAEAAQEAAII